MAVLRTPEERFADLADFPFTPRFLELADPELGSLRVHYVDEGPRGAPTIVLLHGQATWSYSYRNMIPLLCEAGYRVVAPDFIGFGRSDKPADISDHSYQKHVDWLSATLMQLQITHSTGFLFDWGGFFGLRVAINRPEIFDRLILSTTTLPLGKGLLNAAWVAWWRRHVAKPEEFPISTMVDRMTARPLSDTTRAGLDAPYPDERYKAGPRSFPGLIPATFLNPAAAPNREAWQELTRWTKPTLTLVSEKLAKRGFNPSQLHAQIPGTRGQRHATYADSGFFLIEDAPHELAAKTLEFIRDNPGEAC